MGRRLAVITFVVFGGLCLWWGQRAFEERGVVGPQTYHREPSSDQLPKTQSAQIEPQNPKLNPPQEPHLAPSTAVEPLKLGDSLESIGFSKLRIWEHVSVAPNASVPSGAKVEASVSGFSIYTDSQASSRLNRFDIRQPVAVYDERTHRAGIITGTLIIVLQPGKSWDAVSNQHGLSLISANDATNTYMATASRSPFDLENTFKTLGADNTNVAAVRIEILSRTYRKN